MKSFNFHLQSKGLHNAALQNKSEPFKTGKQEVLPLNGRQLLNGNKISSEEYCKMYTSDVKLKIMQL